MILSTMHFRERWIERVGLALPTPDEIETMLRESVVVQEQRDLFSPRGRRYRILAAYWNPVRRLILKVDHKSNKTVTVLTPELATDAHRNTQTGV